MDKETSREIVEVTPPQNQNLQISELRDPEKEIEFAQKAAKALVGIINSKKKKVVINGEQYLEYGDWQTIARFYGITVGTEQTEEINKNGKLAGFIARAVVYRNGVQISSAEASCMRDEHNWATKPEFQLRSMAQTRAAAKALRNVLGWVVELAGYSDTPAEEIVDGKPPIHNPGKPPIHPQNVKPANNYNNSDKQKIEIKKLCDEIEPLLSTVDDYKKFVLDKTKLELTEKNYSEIINRLRAIKNESFVELPKIEPAKPWEKDNRFNNGKGGQNNGS